jgi:hypothetical protein
MPADSLENLTSDQRAELNIGRLTRKLLTDPETREDTAKLLKKADSNLQFPDITAKEEARKALDKQREDIAELERKLLERDARDAISKQHQRIKDAGLDVKMVTELMEKHGIPPTEDGYGIVMELVQSRQQLAEPTTEQLQPFRIPDVKEMWNDPVKWREEQGYKVLNEMIAGRKRA